MCQINLPKTSLKKFKLKNRRFQRLRVDSANSLFGTSIKMNSLHSDTESNVSGFIRYSNDGLKKLYTSAIKSLQYINQDVLEVERNLTNIVKHSGHLEKQVTALLQSLPQPNISLTVED